MQMMRTISILSQESISCSLLTSTKRRVWVNWLLLIFHMLLILSLPKMSFALTFQTSLDASGWYLAQDFGSYNSSWGGYHLGEDYVSNNGAELRVKATANGIVKHVASHTGYGYVVIIQHDLGDGTFVCSVYGHLRQNGIISIGSSVTQGQVIGYMSSNYNENGGYNFTHLHFGIRSGSYSTALDSDGKWRYRGYGPSSIKSLWYDPTDFINAHSSAVGYASVSSLSLSQNPVILGQNFNISFTLKEIQGASKSYESVAVAILRSDNTHLFDFAMYNNVTVAANGTVSKTATNYLYASSSVGTYKAIVRGKINGQWFDFSTTGSGVNPKSFSAVAPSPDITKPTINSFDVTPGSVSLGSSFTISYNVSDSGGSGLMQAELWFAPDNSGSPGVWNNIKTNLHSGNGPVSGTFTHAPAAAGTYWYGLHAVDNAGNWTPESSPKKITVVPVNNLPAGWLDAATCETISGWARDPDTTSPISVHIYANGPAGQGIYVTSAQANLLRSDLPFNDKYHGFSLTTPSSLKDGQAHQIYVYGIDSSGGTNPLLSGSPKSITCSSQYTLTVNSAGSTNVSITGSPSVYSGATNYSKAGIPNGTSVTLTAPTISGNAIFDKWSGDCGTNAGNTCIVTMGPNKTVTANYTTPVYTLTVNSAGVTNVAITGSPSAYSGATSYSKTGIPNGTSVTLTAPTISGSAIFDKWSGDCGTNAGNMCIVTMGPNMTVTANYFPVTGAPSSITVPGSDPGDGYVVSWGPSVTSSVTYELQEATDSGFTSGVRTVYRGTGLNAAIPSRANGTYYYRVKAIRSGYTDSRWRNSSNGCVVGASNSVTLGNALDNTALIWTSGGDSTWSGQNAISHDGVDAAQSGVLADGQQSFVQTTVTGPGKLSYYWKISSQSYIHNLCFYIDDNVDEVKCIGGTTNWALMVFNIAPGLHTLTWVTYKYGSGIPGSDYGWFDQVDWRPEAKRFPWELIMPILINNKKH